MSAKSHLISQCSLGLEAEAAAEMRDLGFNPAKVHEDKGVIEWDGTLEDLGHANRCLRCTDRITVRATEFRARGFEELVRKAAAVEWERWFTSNRRLILRVSSRNSRLYHERAIAERVHGAIAARLDREVELAPAEALDDPDCEAQLVIVRFERDLCTLRVDTSGPRLHRRGYRLATAKAPIRETLAASILRWSGWTPGLPLIDPFCGSGTFVIEAARMAAQIDSGANRSFAFERWPGYAAPAPAAPTETFPIDALLLGSDREEGAIRAAVANAERAGVGGLVGFEQKTASACVPGTDQVGHIVTNPPYGQRTGGDDLLPLYAAFGRVLAEHFLGWQLSMVCVHPSHAAAMELDWQLGPWINNGGLRVKLLRATIS